jgi:hypothetical protein
MSVLIGCENPVRTLFVLIACIVHMNPFSGVDRNVWNRD